MILLAVILLAGKLRQLLGLVDIVGVIPVKLNLKAIRIHLLQFGEILSGNIVELENFSIFFAMLHQRVDRLLLISRSHRKGVRIDAVYLAEYQIVLHNGESRVIKPGPEIDITVPVVPGPPAPDVSFLIP